MKTCFEKHDIGKRKKVNNWNGERKEHVHCFIDKKELKWKRGNDKETKKRGSQVLF